MGITPPAIHVGRILEAKIGNIHPIGGNRNLIHRNTVSYVAQALGVSRATISRIINGKHGISAGMAIRLGLAFGTTPDAWLRAQCEYDLWVAAQEPKPEVKPLRHFTAKGILDTLDEPS